MGGGVCIQKRDYSIICICSSISNFVIIWVSPEADARTRIAGQIEYLGDNPWTCFGEGELESGTGKGRWPVKVVSSSRALLWATGIYPC